MVAEHGMCLLTGVPCTKEAGFEVRLMWSVLMTINSSVN